VIVAGQALCPAISLQRQENQNTKQYTNNLAPLIVLKKIYYYFLAVQAVQLNVSICLCLFIYLLLFFRGFPCKSFFIKRKLRWILNVYHILVISNDLLTTHCYFSKMMANSSDLNPNKSFSHFYAGLFAIIIQMSIIWNIIFKRCKVFKLPEMYWFAGYELYQLTDDENSSAVNFYTCA